MDDVNKPSSWARVRWYYNFLNSLSPLYSFLFFEKFRNAILKAHFYQSPNDSSPFFKRTSRGCTILPIYVDVVIISGNDKIGKCYLTSTWRMKDLGPLTYFLGLEISCLDERIRLSTTLCRSPSAHLSNSRSTDTPFELNVSFIKLMEVLSLVHPPTVV